METTETFKRVYINGDEKNLPEIGTETIYFKPYVGIYTGQYLEEDKETWMNDVVWYLSPINEAQGKWISIKDQTPPEYERVLWIDKRDGFINLDYFVWSQTPVDYVTHWMKLPNKPEIK
jgi:hypothetical protein